MTEASQEKPDAAEEDLRLIERILGGDLKAFEALVRSHERRVFRVTLAVLGQVEDAEDAMQETFIKAYRHLDQFRYESRFTTWLTRIAVNEALASVAQGPSASGRILSGTASRFSAALRAVGCRSRKPVHKAGTLRTRGERDPFLIGDLSRGSDPL